MGLPRLRALFLLLKRTPPAALSPSVTLMRAPVLKAGRYSGTIECGGGVKKNLDKKKSGYKKRSKNNSN